MEILKELEQDDIFRHFVDDSFNTVLFSSNILKNSQSNVSVENSMAKINSFVTKIDNSIQSIVTENHKQLLDKVKKVDKLKTSLDNGARGVDTLVSNIDEIKRDVILPFNEIKEKTHELKDMQLACELLRGVLRLSFSIKKVESQIAIIKGDKGNLNNLRDLAKVAISLSELENIMADVRLRGIDIVEEKRGYVTVIGQEVRLSTTRVLHASISSMNQTETGNALQVFFNLNCLDDKVNGAIAYISNRVANIARGAFDQNAITQNIPEALKSTKDLSTVPAWRASFWGRFDALVEAIISCSLQMWTFHRVLSKKKDLSTFSQIKYIDLLKRDRRNIIVSFWEQMTTQLSIQLENGGDAYPPIKSILVSEYPKLREKFISIISRLHKNTSSVSRDREVVIIGSTPYEKETLLRAISPFFELFLAKSLSKMNEPVTTMFPSNSEELTPRLPIARDIQTFINVITNELSSAGGDIQLLVSIGKNVVKSVQLFSSKIENLFLMDPASIDISSTRTSSQKYNGNLIALLEQLSNSLMKLTNEDDTKNIFINLYDKNDIELLSHTLQPSFTCLSNLVRECLLPYLNSISRRLECIIMKMHVENHNKGVIASVYLLELEKEVNRIMTEHLSKITPCPSREKLLSQLSCRLIMIFVRHAALLRPLSEEGKLKIAQDMATLEMIVTSIASGTKNLGASYKELRAFRQFIFADVNSLIINEVQDLRPSTVFHHLISRSPPELQSPHQLSSTTPEEYSNWIDAQTGGDANTINIDFFSQSTFQSEEAIWGRVRNCLDAYAQRMKTSRDVREDNKKHLTFNLLIHGGGQLLSHFKSKCY